MSKRIIQSYTLIVIAMFALCLNISCNIGKSNCIGSIRILAPDKSVHYEFTTVVKYIQYYEISEKNIQEQIDSISNIEDRLKNEFTNFKISKNLYKGQMDSLEGQKKILFDYRNKIQQVELEWENALSFQTPDRIRRKVMINDGLELAKKAVNNTTVYADINLYKIPYQGNYEWDYLRNSNHFVEKPLTIANKENIQITGPIGKFSRFISYNKETVVIRFINCKNISLNNIIIGHDTNSIHQCGPLAFVLQFENCKNVMLDSCKLFGSGSWGIVAGNVIDFVCKHSEIYNCNQGIMDINSGQNFYFYECKFRDVVTYAESIFKFTNCLNFTFNTCSFIDNWHTPDSVGDGIRGRPLMDNYLFEVNGGEPISIINSEIKRDSVYYFARTPEDVKIQRTFLKDNFYSISQFQNYE